MNIPAVIIEIVVMFAIFTFLTIGLLLISPLTFISDYPPEIQDEYYRSQHKEATREKLTVIMRIKKIVAVIVYVFIAAWMLHIAGCQSFLQGLGYVYLLIFALFAYDTFFLDWVVFANLKKLRLPGTEHMDKEYHQKWFHVKACIPAIPVCLLMGVLASLVMIWIW